MEKVSLCVEELLAKLEQQEREIAHLRSLTTTDELTGVYNRRGVMNALNVMLANQQRHGGVMYLGFADIDGFKSINDIYSHKAGDLALKTISRRLKGVVRKEDIVGRLGGDEFIVIGHYQSINARTLTNLGNRMVKLGQKPISLNGVEVKITLSIGIVQYSGRDSLTAETLVELADKQMYNVKRSGKCGFTIQEINQSRPISIDMTN